jgi:hypothetical protein
VDSAAAEALPISSDLRPTEKPETGVLPDVVMVVFLVPLVVRMKGVTELPCQALPPQGSPEEGGVRWGAAAAAVPASAAVGGCGTRLVSP